MVNYSYNDIKQEFEDLRENWMTVDLSPFQAPPNDNTSDADSKIYKADKYRAAINFFLDKLPLNPFCKRVNCFNINLKHTHSHPETKQEYAGKIVRFLKNWQNLAHNDNRLDQNELDQLSRVIELWEKKSPLEAQEKALREHWNQTTFNNWLDSDACLDMVDKLKKEIKDGKITDDTDQPPDPNDHELCSACLPRYHAAENWETNYRQSIKTNCLHNLHYPIDHTLEQKIHHKCFKKVKKNEQNDIQPCGCSNVKSSDLLELTSENLVKSFFVLDKVKSIKKVTHGCIGIEYLNGNNKEVKNSQEFEAFEDLKTYLQSSPVGQEITRRDLGIVERDDPDNDKELEETRIKLLDYFKEENISFISLRGNKLVIKYKNRGREEEKEPDSTELQLVKSYLQAKGISYLTLSDLERSNTQQPRDNKPLFYAIATVLVFVVIVLIAFLAYQSRKSSQQRG